MQPDEVKIEEKEKSIHDISIKTISQKTNLSTDVIQHLFDKSFDSFSYPQAIGAITIIEREFDMNLNTLKNECRSYFKEHPVEDGVSVVKAIPKSSVLIPQILIVALLMFVSYSGWYFFSAYYNKQIIPPKNIEKINLEKTMVNQDDFKKKIITTKPIKDIIIQPVKIQEVNNSINKEENKSDISTKPAIIEILDENSSEKNTTIVTIEEENKTKKIEQELPLLTSSQIVIEEPVKEEITIVTPPTPRKIITLIPNEYMWFRLINLTDKKRRAYKRRTHYKIDMRDNDWLFAAENVSFSFKDMGKTALYGGEGKLFYKLDQNGIHKLTKSEFRALEK